MEAGTPRIRPVRTPGRKIKTPRRNHVVVKVEGPINRSEVNEKIPGVLNPEEYSVLFSQERKVRNIPLTGTPVVANAAGRKIYSATYTRKNAAGTPLPVNFTEQGRAERTRTGNFAKKTAVFAANAAQQANTLNEMIQRINLSPLEPILSGYPEHKKQAFRDHYKRYTIQRLIKSYLLLVPGVEDILNSIIEDADSKGATLQEKVAAIDLLPLNTIFDLAGFAELDPKLRTYMILKYRDYVIHRLRRRLNGENNENEDEGEGGAGAAPEPGGGAARRRRNRKTRRGRKN